MARASVKRRRNHRLLTNWLNPRPLHLSIIFSRYARAYTRFTDRRRHRRYCLHRSNLLMARSTRWIRDRVSCVVCIPIARRDPQRGPRIDHAGEREDTPLPIDFAVRPRVLPIYSKP